MKGGWWLVVEDEKWLSVAELARLANVPESTTRRYLTRFADFLRFEERSKGKRYHPDSIKVIAHISDMYSNGFEADEIERNLVRLFPINVMEEEMEETNVHGQLANRAIVTKEDLSSIVTKEDLTSLTMEFQNLKEEIIKLRQENGMLIEQLADRINERDKMLMETMRVLQEQKKEVTVSEEKKSFWSRLFGK